MIIPVDLGTDLLPIEYLDMIILTLYMSHEAPGVATLGTRFKAVLFQI